MVVLGHSPYVMTPYRLMRTGDPAGRAAPHTWRRDQSGYGPLGSAEQAAAAERGGTSAARITFWLSCGPPRRSAPPVVGLDRRLRSDPAQRARAHLLWSLNPLLLWDIVAGG